MHFGLKRALCSQIASLVSLRPFFRWLGETMVTLYGIKNCDTVKKARKWLEQHQVEYRFHDFRADGITLPQIQAWHTELGDALINRRSTTWKQLTDAERSQAEAQPAGLLLANPTLIKRPLLDTGTQRVCGFKADEYTTIFK
ncbi:protein yffB [Simiduia agarivorans SA1 = DSM 21679]|uniref:Protein yffB n=2 Tax=Simiduia TaxID=447467 RepID=K4KH04_SIMAS|nr:protein yffB [Simiduia agarivorans SA1 = DSM 21679]